MFSGCANSRRRSRDRPSLRMCDGVSRLARSREKQVWAPVKPVGVGVPQAAACRFQPDGGGEVLSKMEFKKKKKKGSSSLFAVFPNLAVTFGICRLAAGGERRIGGLCTATAVNKRSRAERGARLGLGVPALSPGRVAQFSVEVGVKKSWVRVVLHQAVDFPLSRQEDVDVRLVEALDDGVFGVEVQVYLRSDRSSERQHQTRRLGGSDVRRTSVTSLGASLFTNSS